MTYTPEALRQVDALLRHYEALERDSAARALLAALAEAERRIERKPTAGLAAPRPYPELAAEGDAWVKAGRHWIGYRTTEPPAIFAVFFETADIPGRLYHGSARDKLVAGRAAVATDPRQPHRE